MRCPVDKKDMIVVEHEKIELDYCLQCAGVWFDASELELLVEALKRQGAQITQAVPDDDTASERQRGGPQLSSLRHQNEQSLDGQGTPGIDR